MRRGSALDRKRGHERCNSESPTGQRDGQQQPVAAVWPQAGQGLTSHLTSNRLVPSACLDLPGEESEKGRDVLGME